MSRLGKKLRGLEGGRVAFFCPGCNEMHQITVDRAYSPQGPVWGYDGDPDCPTFTPSILVRGTRLDLTDDELEAMWEEFPLPEARAKLLADHRYNFVCHSFVTKGQILFLSDCTHALAGKTVPLPDLSGSGRE
jgi:hypothetical protein